MVLGGPVNGLAVWRGGAYVTTVPLTLAEFAAAVRLLPPALARRPLLHYCRALQQVAATPPERLN
ncbi:hypothetical protein [Hymenobacter arizonensis]|uniref:hypothetical protein n=1 Tax=Hymenobacter arizonensis TaxID=1227077 RepID=UPI000B82F739|nr:hypothetical protein [Hymenobacter arizonensis]